MGAALLPLRTRQFGRTAQFNGRLSINTFIEMAYRGFYDIRSTLAPHRRNLASMLRPCFAGNVANRSIHLRANCNDAGDCIVKVIVF
jgi:hypothetical protein